MPRWILFSMITVLMYGLWGFLAVFTDGEPGHYNIHSFVVCSVLSVGLLPTLVPAALSRSFSEGREARRGNLIAFLSGIVASVANIGTFLALRAGGPATVVIPLTAAYPILTVIAAVLLLRERIHWVQLLGILVGVSGAILLSTTVTGETADGLSFFDSLRGVILKPWFWWTIMNLVGQAVLGLLYKLSTNEVSPERSFVLFGIAFSLCSFGAYILDILVLRQLSWHLSLGGWFVCVGLGITMGLGILAQITACKYGKAAIVTAITSLYPAVTTGLLVIFLDHHLPQIALLGTILVLAGGTAMIYEK